MCCFRPHSVRYLLTSLESTEQCAHGDTCSQLDELPALAALSAAWTASLVWYAATVELHILQVFTSVQDAMGLVHMYPFLPDAMEYMDCIASLQGSPDALQEPVTQADWDALLAYCAKVTAADHFQYVPLLHSALHPGQATPAAAYTPNHSVLAANQMPSPVQKSVHFSPDSVLGHPPFSSSQSHGHSGSPSLQPMKPPAYSPTTPPPPLATGRRQSGPAITWTVSDGAVLKLVTPGVTSGIQPAQSYPCPRSCPILGPPAPGLPAHTPII